MDLSYQMVISAKVSEQNVLLTVELPGREMCRIFCVGLGRPKEGSGQIMANLGTDNPGTDFSVLERMGILIGD